MGITVCGMVASARYLSLWEYFESQPPPLPADGSLSGCCCKSGPGPWIGHTTPHRSQVRRAFVLTDGVVTPFSLCG